MGAEESILEYYENRVINLFSELFNLPETDIRICLIKNSESFVEKLRELPQGSHSRSVSYWAQANNEMEKIYSQYTDNSGFETHLHVIDKINDFFLEITSKFSVFFSDEIFKPFIKSGAMNVALRESLNLDQVSGDNTGVLLRLRSENWNSIFVDTSSKHNPKYLDLGFSVECTSGRKNIIDLQLSHYSFLSGFLSLRSSRTSRQRSDKVAIERVSFCLSIIYFKKFVRALSTEL